MLEDIPKANFKDFFTVVNEKSKKAPNSVEIENNSIFGVFKKNLVQISIGKELWPTDEEILLVSIDDQLNLLSNSLHDLVLQKIGINIDEIEISKRDYLEIKNKGFISKNLNNRIVYFISTIQNAGDNILSNPSKIEKTISTIFDGFNRSNSFDSLSFYMPLLGTGAADFPIPHSFDIAMTSIETLAQNSSKDIKITLSLPPETININVQTILQYFDSRWNILNEPKKKEINDKIDFLLDRPTYKDKLGRRPIARSLARLINNDVFTNDSKNSSFMIHLQGKWGEGKTSFMNFFEQELKEGDEANWIVIKYNAWKNQHIDPPWWTFIDSLYQQGKKFFKGLTKLKIIISEFFRRLNHKTLLNLIFIGLMFFVVIKFIDFFTINFTSYDTIKFIVAVLTLGSMLVALGKKSSDFFLLNSPKSVRLFINHVGDPNAHIKQHFKELFNQISQAGVKDDNTRNRIAIFIDDLDRCNAQYVVKLLEGIQTL
ncbi:MAG: P-loop NTPase fold protein, partial [Candidatus Paceibacterota bacterium]